PDIHHSEVEERYIAYGPSPAKGGPCLWRLPFEAARMKRAPGICTRRRLGNMKKKTPKFKSDREAADFLEQDLSDYIDPGKAQRVTFEFCRRLKKSISAFHLNC